MHIVIDLNVFFWFKKKTMILVKSTVCMCFKIVKIEMYI